MELIDLRFKDLYKQGFREKVAGPFLVTCANDTLVMDEFHFRVFPLCWVNNPDGRFNNILKTDGR